MNSSAPAFAEASPGSATPGAKSRSCFPALASVQTLDGKVRMKDLLVGDKVRANHELGVPRYGPEMMETGIYCACRS